MEARMKAISYTSYGPPEVLKLQEIEKPVPREDEVLVKVQAASVNYGDKALVRGEPSLIRLMGYGLLSPKYAIPGGDIAGSVEAVGGNVKEFHPGDEVFGDIGAYGFGAFAEYVSAPASALVMKPANVTFEEAAAVPQAAVVALQGLRDKGRIQPGQKVLINGASGGVGSFAVQIAKAFDAEVTGVSSTRNLEMVRSLGADHVIDYTQEDFTEDKGCYDLIFDIVANRSISDYMRALTPKGSYVACAFNPTSLFFGSLVSKADGKRVSSLSHKPNRSDLVFIAELLAAAKVVSFVDRVYRLSQVPEAIRYLEEGPHRGKVVVTMEGA
jgi:NADPH:quinone reductase-like Zn-dependent oxidoreductase